MMEIQCLAIRVSGNKCTYPKVERSKYFCEFHQNIVDEIGLKKFEMLETEYKHEQTIAVLNEDYEEELKQNKRNPKKIQELKEHYQEKIKLLDKEHCIDIIIMSMRHTRDIKSTYK